KNAPPPGPLPSLTLSLEELTPTEAESAVAIAGQAQLRLALVGRPFAGKSTTALALAELLLPAELVHAAISEFQSAEAQRAGAGDGAEGAEGESLGEAAMEAIAAGKAVPDEVLAALVVKAVGAIDESRAGFLIDGFPSTPAQLALLEKGLT
ncbi:hypothetical protein T492DRAFT_893159, partial [Pavlovales sp. CCMP2436]